MCTLRLKNGVDERYDRQLLCGVHTFELIAQERTSNEKDLAFSW